MEGARSAAAAGGGAGGGASNGAVNARTAPNAASNAAGSATASSSRNATASPANAAPNGARGGSTGSIGSSATASGAPQQAYKPLNVKDALSYLDQVKHQFRQQPQIYNSFLDIMKDFKTQNIDTPGVIQRVSTLFRGHPRLIQGFNTFLPEGYRIDCSFDPTDNGLITVTTPAGVTRRDHNGVVQQQAQGSTNGQTQGQSPAGQSASSAPQSAQQSNSQTQQQRQLGAQDRPQGQQQPGTNAQPPLRAPGLASGNARTQPAVQPPHRAPYSSLANTANASQANNAPAPSSSLHPHTDTTAAGQLSRAATPSAASTDSRQKPPTEFNHAINFVNKIKNRFTRRPDIYKSFLEILQTYQKEQRPIQDVYAQVTTLFKDAPDLLDEFKEFLPDTSGQAALSQQTALTAAAHAPQSQIQAAPVQTVPITQQQASLAGTSRTARNSSTTSLFGVNPSSTSQPQPGPAAPYLTAGKDRKGQPMAPPTLDAAASRKPGAPAAMASTSNVPYERADQQLVNNNPNNYDADWQAPSSAKRRRAPTGAAAAAEKQKAKRRMVEGSPELAMTNNNGQISGTNGYGKGYPAAAGYPTTVDPVTGQPLPVGAVASTSAASLQGAVPAAVQPIIIPHPTRPHGPRNQLQSLVSVDELSLFDRIKKYIDDKATFHEFLKLLNLYTQEIIDMPTLLEKAFLFIGSSDEIFGLFREFVGEQDGFVEGEEWPIDNAPALERERFELFALKSYGPSYRKLPYSESKGLACSGRDALCWSVLNDDWVAFATWASEGSGAHRKNPYEDALAGSEQERHWYDYHLESVRRSIALIEPIVARISLMTMEERSQFRLKPGLGGESSSFYERMIRKIYGRDQGYEAINALYESPAVAAPIILNRLKQKDEEWGRALREWNRVWREVDAKNFYRSLDHQGVAFKTNDKKTTTSKYLLGEIESLRRDQQQKRISLTPASADSQPLRPRHQYEMHVHDNSVLFDVLKLILAFLDRATTPYTSKERTAIENTLRRMIPLIFCIEEREVEANIALPIVVDGDGADGAENGGMESDAEDSAMSDTAASASDASATIATASAKKGKKGAADLRKKLLSNTAGANGTHGDKDGQTANGDSTTASSSVTLDEGSWIAASSEPYSISPAAATPSSSPRKRNPLQSPEAGARRVRDPLENEAPQEARYNFFASQPFYCFIRLFHMLYHRLATLKHSAQLQAESSDTSDRLNPFAVELGLAVPIPSIDEPGTPRGKNFYEYMLELCEKLFDSEIDAPTFEENLRYMWGIKAFPAFTVDKVIATMTKHVHAINQDQRCHQLLDLLKQDREKERTTLRHQIVYRHAAEQVVGVDENLFRLEWIPSAKALAVQLLSPDDLTLDDPVLSPNTRWNHYVDAFTLNQPTEGLNAEVNPPLLTRNRPPSGDGAAVTDGNSNLGIRLSYDDFKLSYVRETEETLYRAKTKEGDEQAEQQVRARKREAWEKWLAGQQPAQTSDDIMVPQTVVGAENVNGDEMDLS